MRSIAFSILATFGMLNSSVALIGLTPPFVDICGGYGVWDTRDVSAGCGWRVCDGPYLTIDNSLDDESRWSCSEDLIGSTCKICYEFAEPQDIAQVCLALWKGDERVREIKMTFKDADGNTSTTIFTSSGTTPLFECVWVDTDETLEVHMEPYDLPSDEWLSILEVKFIVG